MTDGGTTGPDGRLRRHSELVAITAALIAVAAPVLWMILGRDDRYTGDMALIEMRVRDVFSSDPPVAGAYSRYGWAHPGPWQFYLFAVPYRLFGADARALQLTTLLFNLAVAATILWLAMRRNRTTAIAMMLTLLALIAGLRPLSLAYGWNVTVTVLPLVLVAIGCWRTIAGDRAALPVTVAAAIFVGSTHVGVGVVILPIVLVTVAIATGRLFGDRAVTADRIRDRFATGAIASLVIVAAIPLLLDIVDDPPGNIGRLLRWSVTNDEPKVGIADSLRMVGRSSSLSFVRDPELPGRFLLDLGPVDPGVLPGVSIVLLGLALLVSHRRNWSDERLWCVLMLGLWATGVVAAAVVTEPLGWWLVQWMQPIGWLTWSAIGLVAWRLASERTPPDRSTTVTRFALAGVVLIGATFVVDHARDAAGAPDPRAEFVRPVDELTGAIIAEVDSEPARLEFAGTSLLAETMLSGVVNRLDAIGVDMCSNERLAYKLGEHRVCRAPTETTFVLRSEPRTLPPPEGTRLVIDVDPLSPAERLEADELSDRIADVLTRNDRDEQVSILDSPLADVVLLGDPPAELVAMTDDVERLAELRKVPGDRYVLYATS